MKIKKISAFAALIVFFLAFPSAHAVQQTRTEMPELIDISFWLNTQEPPTKASLKGHVVLIDFFNPNTVTSNQKAAFLNTLQLKYASYGFKVLAIVTPEYPFDTDKTLLLEKIKKLKLAFPVGVDINHTQWNAYNNLAKCLHYLVDAQGRIYGVRYPSEPFKNTEHDVQELLVQSGQDMEDLELEKFDPPTAAMTDTIYLNSKKISRLGNEGKLRSESAQNFILPKELQMGLYYLEGNWKIQETEFVLAEGGGALTLVWDGRPVYLLASSKHESPIPSEITVDGNPLSKKMKSKQVIIEGGKSYFFIQEPGLYELNQPFPAGRYIMKIVFQDTGVQAYKIILTEALRKDGV